MHKLNGACVVAGWLRIKLKTEESNRQEEAQENPPPKAHKLRVQRCRGGCDRCAALDTNPEASDNTTARVTRGLEVNTVYS